MHRNTDFLSPSLPDFYRQVLVFTLLAVTTVGLIPITVMVYRDWQQKRHSPPPHPSPEQADQSEGIQNSPSSKASYGVDPDEREELLSTSGIN